MHGVYLPESAAVVADVTRLALIVSFFLSLFACSENQARNIDSPWIDLQESSGAAVNCAPGLVESRRRMVSRDVVISIRTPNESPATSHVRTSCNTARALASIEEILSSSPEIEFAELQVQAFALEDLWLELDNSIRRAGLSEAALLEPKQGIFATTLSDALNSSESIDALCRTLRRYGFECVAVALAADDVRLNRELIGKAWSEARRGNAPILENSFWFSIRLTRRSDVRETKTAL